MQSDGTFSFEDARGKMTLQRLRPGLVLLVSTGHLGAGFCEPLRREMDREFHLAQQQEKPLVFIADCWDLAGIDTKFREWVEFWLKCHRNDICSIVALLRSRLVVMAANLVNLFLGGGLMRLHSDPKEFVLSIERCVPGLKWHRPVPGLQKTPVQGRGQALGGIR
jgi:hypothetical protein